MPLKRRGLAFRQAVDLCACRKACDQFRLGIAVGRGARLGEGQVFGVEALLDRHADRVEEHFEVASLLGGPRLHVGNQAGRGFLHAPRENDAGKIGDVAPFLQILAAVRGEKGEQRVFHEVDRRNRRDALEAFKVRADRLHGKACGRDQAIGAPASSQERIVHEGHHMRVLMRVDTEIATLVGEGLEIALDLLAEFAGKLLANAVAGRRCAASMPSGIP